jgi:DNA-directed RNA polymerase specialized sigma24 family protein
MLLSLLTATPAPSYVEIARVMGVPVGSIGPTRARCLARLRRQLEAEGITDES